MKYKLVTTAFVLTVIAVSIYAILRPSYDLGLFVDLSRTSAMIRTAIALLILSYVLIPVLRLRLTQFIMLVGSGSLLILGFASIFSPTLFGYLSSYAAIGDVMIAIEGGILGLLAGIQLETRRPNFKKFSLKPAYYEGRLSTLKTTKLLVSQQQ